MSPQFFIDSTKRNLQTVAGAARNVYISRPIQKVLTGMQEYSAMVVDLPIGGGPFFG